MKLGKNEMVTVKLSESTSNTFIIDTVEAETVLVGHPLAGKLLMRVPFSQLDRVVPNVKDSVDRSIDFAVANKSYLDFNTIADLESLGVCYAFNRRLTPRQKQSLANICGIVASVKLNNEIKDAMAFIAKNSEMLDDFNRMWYTNFKDLFSGKQPITSKKQRSSIFNIAGFAMAEMSNPTIENR